MHQIRSRPAGRGDETRGSALQRRGAGLPRRAAGLAGRGAARACRPSRTATTGTPAAPTTPSWQRMLFDAGYAGINWPTEYGGRGATPTEHLIFLEETERARAPYVGMNFVGLLHAGPTLDRRGDRRAEGPPPARRSSRASTCGARASASPNAGSDLASLRTPGHPRRRRLRDHRARRSGPASATSPTTASCSCAPTPRRRSTAASPG